MNTPTGIITHHDHQNRPFMEQNIPNPCMYSTSIRFFLPESDFTTLKFFNVQGKEEAVLINESFQDGFHTINVPVSHLSRGLHFIALSGTRFCLNQKMIVQ